MRCRVLTLPSTAALADAIARDITEDGSVADTATPEVQRTRARVATLEGRLRSLLAKQPGEVTELGGRFCVAVATGGAARPARGMVLGSGGSGAVEYVEPAAAVPVRPACSLYFKLHANCSADAMLLCTCTWSTQLQGRCARCI